MRTNTPVGSVPLTTHEGGHAVAEPKVKELKRTVATCLLFENTFYEGGLEIAGRIDALVKDVRPEVVSQIAIEARTTLKLRHVPLWIARCMTKHHQGSVVGDTIAAVIRRPDELGEFLSLYWKGGKGPLSAQVKRGLAQAFTKFNAYQLAKWDRDNPVRLKDVLFLCHAKPHWLTDKGNDREGKVDAQAIVKKSYKRGLVERHSTGQGGMWKHLIEGTLPVPDTWETELSAGKDKKETFERLLTGEKLGYMALLSNLRNMWQAGVDRHLIEKRLTEGAKNSPALPFRFISAWKAAPEYMGALSDAMCAAISGNLPGHTVIVIDVSGSMDAILSEKGTLTRLDAASALAVLFQAVCEKYDIYTFSDKTMHLNNPRRGLQLVKEISESQLHRSTQLFSALGHVQAHARGTPTRVVVITDEQAHDSPYGKLPMQFAKKGYVVNVAPYEPSLDIDRNWTRVNGWSERLVDWICMEEYERLLMVEGEEE